MRLWYVTTAVHLWRFYFRFRTADPNRFTEPSQLNWEACDRAIKSFTGPEIELLNKYYMTGYGKFEDMQAVDDYAEQTGINRTDIWNVIKRANYEVIVERGLMDRKEEQNR